MKNNLFQEAARQAGYYFEIIFPTDPSYNKKREISNSRFDLRPSAIAYCEEADHVSFCLRFCSEYGYSFRVRSGGHQHEGMCSGDGLLVIDLSKMNQIRYLGQEMMEAWIPPGKKLKEVYKELESKGRIIPGGGCGSVCVGGLTQGGGWGPSARLLGLTCDNIEEVEIVLADGNIVHATATNEYKGLFWGLRGGGGGNFGIVTNFRFRLFKLEGPLTTFSLHWGEEDMEAITACWMGMQAEMDRRLTTFCRLSVTGSSTPDKVAVLIGGQFYGGIEELKLELEPLLQTAPPTHTEFKAHEVEDSSSGASFTNSALQVHGALADVPLALGRLLQPAVARENEEAPPETCDAPHPHKVSSAFPQGKDYTSLSRKIAQFIRESEASPFVNTYLSLHGMGGAITDQTPEESAFPYRYKDFMFQFQAWWSDPLDPLTPGYITWIENFRQSLQGEIEGAFINFPDKLLASDRIDLLRLYYAENLPRLRKLKKVIDPQDLFSFGMSIPPA